MIARDDILGPEPPIIRSLFEDLMEEVKRRYQNSREKSLVITKLDEAAMWLAQTHLEGYPVMEPEENEDG